MPPTTLLAQVEVDEFQINLDRFSLFYPEQRPFFLENSAQFTVGDPARWSSSLVVELVSQATAVRFRSKVAFDFPGRWGCDQCGLIAHASR